MKVFLIVLLIFSLGYAGSTPPDTSQVSADTTEPKTVQPGSQISLADLQKFYIGVSTSESGDKLITLDVSSIDSTDSQIWFEYLLNTKDSRESGEGRIFPDRKIIKFGKEETGKIYRAEDGKIVFESTHNDSLNHWKLKER